MKIIVCGMGKLFERHRNELHEEDIVCFADNDIAKQKAYYFGKPVISPYEINNYSFDAIVVFTSQSNYEEISYQLVMEAGIDCRKVLKWDYFLGENFYNAEMIANVLNLLFCQKNIRNILDIGAVIGRKQLWNIRGNVDLLTESSRYDYLGFYQERFCEKSAVEKQYDIALIDEAYLQKYSVSQLTVYAANVLSILPIEEAEMLISRTDREWTIINLAGYLFGYIRRCPRSIKVFEVSHKEFMPVKENCYLPLFVGNGRDLISEGIRDNNGDHISQWNSQINECTALYWMWKNTDFEVLGLNHYRRFFKSEINSFMLQEAEIELWMDGFDLLVAKRAFSSQYTIEAGLKNNVCEEAFTEGMRCLNEVAKGMGAMDRAALQYVFCGHGIYPCNMFIASRKVMSEYCSWLFPILFQLLEKAEIKEEWDSYNKRIIGFIAERLFTVWVIQQKYRVKELEKLIIGDKTVGTKKK